VARLQDDLSRRAASPFAAVAVTARRWAARLRRDHAWLDHLARAGARYVDQRGNHFAAAITFFSILTAVPLVMIAFAAAGYVLSFNPALLAEVKDAVTAALPAGLSDSVDQLIDRAVEERNAVAGLGLLGALWAGVWWMSNLREAVSAQWRLPAVRPAAVQRLALDLAALVGLGGALLASFAISTIATRFGGAVLARLGVADGSWSLVLLTVLGTALGIALNWMIFMWVVAWLPRTPVSMRCAAQAAMIGAVGLEVLTQGMTVYLGMVSGSPSGAVFGSLFGSLLFVYVVSRLVVFIAAWAATAQKDEPVTTAPAWSPGTLQVVAGDGPSPVTTTVMVGAAMLVGVLLGVRLRRTVSRGPAE
jgi:membrane protein